MSRSERRGHRHSRRRSPAAPGLAAPRSVSAGTARCASTRTGPRHPEEKLARARDAVCLVNTRGRDQVAARGAPRSAAAPDGHRLRDRHRLLRPRRRAGARHRHLQHPRQDGADRRRARVRAHAGGGQARPLPDAPSSRPAVGPAWTTSTSAARRSASSGPARSASAMARLGRRDRDGRRSRGRSPRRPRAAAELGVRYVAARRAPAERPTSCRCTSGSRRRAAACIGARELGLMKPGAILVNTGARTGRATPRRWSRRSTPGRLGGAALDVFDTEPLAAGHPLLACQQVGPHPAQRRPDAGGHGPPECRRGRQRDRVPGGTAPERRRVVRQPRARPASVIPA